MKEYFKQLIERHRQHDEHVARLRAEGKLPPAPKQPNLTPKRIDDAAAAPKKKLTEKMVTFLRAVTGPKATDSTVAKRLAICWACEHHKTVEHKNEQRLYCGACGCGQWSLAELRTKVTFADLNCPLDPPKWVQESQVAG